MTGRHTDGAVLRYLDVCSGISAPTMAWKPLGWQALCFAEIEAAPRAVLAHHYPDVPLRGDFTEIRGDEYGPVDLLVGGTPCQSFSIAGLRGGLDDERGNLALEYLRLADRARPRWLVWENVPGVLSIDGGRAFGAILGGMAELGYGFAYRVLDAQHFGVPQRRRRVFVVGYLGDWRRAAAVLFERYGMSGHPAPRREAGKNAPQGAAYGISPDCLDRSGEGAGGSAAERSGLGVDFETAYALRAKRAGAVASTGEISHCLNAGGMGRQDYETETLIAHSLRGEGFDASEDGTGRGTPLVPVAFSIQERAVSENLDAGPQGKGYQPDTAYTLEARHHVQAIAFAQNSRDEVRLFGGDGASVGALGAEPGMKQQCYVAFDMRGREGGAQFEGPHDTANIRAASGGSSRSYVAASAVRRLTPRECERLQGFPDDFTLIPYRKGMMADGPRYKMLGNSMAVPVIRWIGERIQAVEALNLAALAA